MDFSISWRKRFLLCLTTPLLLLLSLVPNVNVATAQSTACHTCITNAILSITNCNSLTSSELTSIDSIIHGKKINTNLRQYSTSDPKGFSCLEALMWDVVNYKAKLWGQCLNPTAACPWAEMMQYMEMIPKTASIYGAMNPPPIALVDPPA
ncbi:hypothetical protein BGZ58_001401 [Dissophora ornata]|nr:hypothetical protein BGZ58_001401 [Dissophora ornata]